MYIHIVRTEKKYFFSSFYITGMFTAYQCTYTFIKDISFCRIPIVISLGLLLSNHRMLRKSGDMNEIHMHA